MFDVSLQRRQKSRQGNFLFVVLAFYSGKNLRNKTKLLPIANHRAAPLSPPAAG